MKSWQEMKDLSYVNIKRTKAKSLSEGLSKCKIDKFSRKNPIYEHLQFHKLLQKKHKPLCGICTQSTTKNHTINYSNTPHSLSSIQMKSAALKNQSLADKKFLFKRIKPKIQKAFFYQQQTTPSKSQYLVIKQSLKQFNNVVKKFEKSLKLSRSNLKKVKTENTQMTDYFDIQYQAIQQQLNEDKGVNIYEATQDYKVIKQQTQMQIGKKKLKQRKDLITKMNRPVKFPLGDTQNKLIIQHQSKSKNKQKKKILQLLTNVYEYKSRINYTNKLKILKQYKR